MTVGYHTHGVSFCLVGRRSLDSLLGGSTMKDPRAPDDAALLASFLRKIDAPTGRLNNYPLF